MMRKPKVKNKYNLTYKDLSRLKVLNRDKICEPLFWRNNVINYTILIFFFHYNNHILLWRK